MYPAKRYIASLGFMTIACLAFGQGVVRFNFTLNDVVYDKNSLYLAHEVQQGEKATRWPATGSRQVPFDVICEDQSDCRYTLILASLEIDPDAPRATREALSIHVNTQNIPHADQLKEEDPPGTEYVLSAQQTNVAVPFRVLHPGQVSLRIPFKIYLTPTDRYTLQEGVLPLILNISTGATQPSEAPEQDSEQVKDISDQGAETQDGGEGQQPQPPAKRTGKSDEARAYDRAMASDELVKLEQFLAEYPKSRYVDKVAGRLEELSPMEFSIKQGAGELFRIQIRHAIRPRIANRDSLIKQGLNIYDENLASESFCEISMRVLRDYNIQIVDVQNDSLSIAFGSSYIILEAKVTRDTMSDNYIVEISGGRPPFRIDLIPREGVHPFAVKKISNVRTRNYQLVPQVLAAEGLGGYYNLEIRDNRLTVVQTADQPIYVQAKSSLSDFIRPIGALILLALIFLTGRFIYRRSVRRKEMRLKAVRQTIMERHGDIPATVSPEPPVPVMTYDDRGKASIRITNRQEYHRQKMLEIAAFRNRLNSERFFHYDLDQLWDETCISDLWIREKCAVDLDNFLLSENLDEVRNEEAGEVPEIGGFLMGMYCKAEDETKYLVTLDEFVPIEPERHNIYQLEFSTESLVRKLGDAQDIFPDLLVLGWFHTHPGHSLFLSRPDLVIHRGFFGEKYQLAMQIDSLTKGLDLAFFTQTPSGQINNSVRQKLNWFSWKEMQSKIAK